MTAAFSARDDVYALREDGTTGEASYLVVFIQETADSVGNWVIDHPFMGRHEYYLVHNITRQEVNGYHVISTECIDVLFTRNQTPNLEYYWLISPFIASTNFI